ncbi:uncharacterized protein [Euwallacea similis]|uniref:uncharacterized protein n=1 Tax=Euwallacea similis TaxID=1736056 RepID=UPI00344D77FF
MTLYKLKFVAVLFFVLKLSSAIKTEPHFPLDYCKQIYTLACFKFEVANWLDHFEDRDNLPIVPGVSLFLSPSRVKVHHEVPREFPISSNIETKADDYLRKKLDQFLSSHSIKINLWALIGEQSAETGREDKYKKGDSNTGIILMAVAMLASVLTTFGMASITALAGKALITGVISFVLSIVIGVKELVGNEHSQVPRAVVVIPEGWGAYGEHVRSANRAELVVNEVSNTSAPELL